MFNSINSGVNRLEEALDKFASINHWPIVIGLLILSFGLSLFIQYMQIKRASKQFAAGFFDDKTIRLCERIKRRSIFPHAAELHDIFCYRLSAIYMAKNNESLFFENINSIKNVTQDISWRLHLLLAAYLTNQSYMDMVTLYQTIKAENRSTIDTVKQLLQEYDRNTISDKAIVAKEKITNRQILEILLTLTKEQETGYDDSSLS